MFVRTKLAGLAIETKLSMILRDEIKTAPKSSRNSDSVRIWKYPVLALLLLNGG